MPGDEPSPDRRTGRWRVVAVGAGSVPILAALGVGVGVARVTGIPAVVAGLVVLTLALVASPRLLALVQPAADLLLRLLPALFVPLVVGVAGIGGDVRAAWPAALAAIVVSVPAGFVATGWLARTGRGGPGG
jgi:holin-like protein